MEISMAKVKDQFHLSTLVSNGGPRNSHSYRQVSLISAIIQSGTKWIKLKIHYFGQFPHGE